MPTSTSYSTFEPRVNAPPIDLLCEACGKVCRRLILRDVAQAMAKGRPCLPASCRHCRTRFSAESLARLRQHVYDVNGAAFITGTTFTMYPQGFQGRAEK